MKMITIKYLLLSLIAIIYLQTSTTIALETSQQQIISDALKKVAPNVNVSDAKIEFIEPNLYKIIADSDVFYVSKDGRYFFYGELLDLNEKNTRNWNITNNARKTVRKQELSKFSKKDMLVFKPKKLHYRIKKPLGIVTIFADTSCPHSKRLHKEVEEAVASGLEARYVFFSRAGVGSDSYKQAISIWCSKNRNKEFAMANNDEFIPEKTCKNNPIEEQLKFARKMGINATPSIVLEDGTVLPGFVTAENLLRIVKEEHANSGS